MFNLLNQVGQELSGNSRQPTSTTHTMEKKKKKVQFDDPLIILAEAAKGVKLGDESSDSRENSSDLDKEASVPGLKRRKLIDGTKEKTKLGKTPRMRKVPGSGNDKEKNENTNKNTNDNHNTNENADNTNDNNQDDDQGEDQDDQNNNNNNNNNSNGGQGGGGDDSNGGESNGDKDDDNGDEKKNEKEKKDIKYEEVHHIQRY